MLSFSILLDLSLAACIAASEVRAQLHGAQLCAWTPLTETLLECSTRELMTDNNNDTTPTPRNSTRDHEPLGWTGPHGCAGNYCLYANRGFAAGRGIVVVSTPDNILRVKRLEEELQHQNPEDESTSASGPPFQVTEVDGKGLGMIANRSLARGDVVMLKTPVLLAHRGFIERTPPADKHSILDTVPGLLPAPTRRGFLGQMGHFGGHQVSDILATNSFQMDLGGGDGQHYGNFYEVSRYNHDCRPNVAFRIDDDLRHRTTAVRPVAPGEELTISYLDPLGVRSVRQHRARRAWGFECACSQCSLPRKLSATSDERLLEVEELERRLSDVGTVVTASTVERFLKLYKEERLEAKMAGAYTTAALNYNLLGRNKMAVKYARLAIEAGTIENGPGAPDVEAMRALAADPKKHFTWRGRLR
ncbi:SET domain-containing protein 5-like protein 1 [Colletotrichum chlorophyti]|uniref:SET domain-containing protein 5-like protein 1 n=1 Tax=Colletotrichum chlorophyti TaxID=708187 RepID=A0A1Q8S0T9_9PEZI|nr:SET domain-containing protein 5-like protein 1 [Colletotrichum chlorophyti]